MTDQPDQTRRRLLMRLGLAVTAIYSAPVLSSLAPARASGSGGGGGGGAGQGGGFSGYSGRPRRPRRSARRQRRRIRPEIVVATPSPTDIDRIATQGYGLLSRDTLALLGREVARFSLPANTDLDEARQQILRLVPQALFDPNHFYEPGELSCGNDSCAAFSMIGWQTAAHSCPAGTVIGIVDTGVNTDHGALAGVDIEAFPVLGDGRKSASSVHGTAIAILIAGRRDARTPGLVAGAKIIAAEAFHRSASGQDIADAFDVARAIDRLARRRTPVINLSFAGPDNSVLKEVVRAAQASGIILVAAAGNAGPRAAPLFPAAYDGVVAVTAIDKRRSVYRQAGAGEHIDFAAPGVRLWTAASVSGGRYRSGTSYAAPFVTAALAVARARNPAAGRDELIRLLADGAVDLGPPGRDATFGWGLVQASGSCAG